MYREPRGCSFLKGRPTGIVATRLVRAMANVLDGRNPSANGLQLSPSRRAGGQDDCAIAQGNTVISACALTTDKSVCVKLGHPQTRMSVSSSRRTCRARRPTPISNRTPSLDSPLFGPPRRCRGNADREMAKQVKVERLAGKMPAPQTNDGSWAGCPCNGMSPEDGIGR